MRVVMAKSPGMSPLSPGKPCSKNLTWESAQEPSFTFPDVPVQPRGSVLRENCNGK